MGTCLRWIAATAAVALAALTLMDAPEARACGCFSPPIPVPGEVEDFAVNQSAEQIIFETHGDGTVTAHVLIKYNGDPASFAWLVPVPSDPVLKAGQNTPFAILDAATRPEIRVAETSICPESRYRCAYHPPPSCPGATTTTAFDATVQTNFSDTSSPGPGTNPGGVEVIRRERVGSYETVVFSAEEATGTVDWLNTNGFIVNATMAPYMQPYLDAGMLFIAAKLVAGADVDEIRPLTMTYVHPRPIIPLRLTAVAAEPNLTVTSWIYADETYVPRDQPLTQVDGDDLSADRSGRANYPMVMARAIDEAGGDAFVAEYSGAPVDATAYLTRDSEGCCGGDGQDWCNVGADQVCQCPGRAFDATDCERETGLLEAIAFLDDLGARYTSLTRLTTRLSPEEMTFDPQFEPGTIPTAAAPRRVWSAPRYSLDDCSGDIQEIATWQRVEAEQRCATTYCGPGTCVATPIGAGCACDAGFVARTFTDLDGLSSVTCVPETGTVDLGAAHDVPSACDGVTHTIGTCVDVGGFPTTSCGEGYVGVAVPGQPEAACAQAVQTARSPGAENFSRRLADVEICAPKPPSCGAFGWLERNPLSPERDSVVVCEANEPADAALIPGPPPTCGDMTGPNGADVIGGDMDAVPSAGGSSSNDGCATGQPTPAAWLGLLLFAWLRLRRRRVL